LQFGFYSSSYSLSNYVVVIPHNIKNLYYSFLILIPLD